ncbi:MAG: DUF3987 domain-containing protein [Opitutaceae bacterium]
METDMLTLISQPIRKLKTADAFTGISSASVKAFTEFCRKDTDNSHHMMILSDAPIALELIPNASVQLTFLSLNCEDLIYYALKNASTSTSEIELELECAINEVNNEHPPRTKIDSGHEDKSDQEKKRIEALLNALFLKVNPAGSVVVTINALHESNHSFPNTTISKRAYPIQEQLSMILRLAQKVGFIPRHEEIWVIKDNHIAEESDRSRHVHEYIIILDKSEINSCERSKLTANGLPNDTSVFECPAGGISYGYPSILHPSIPERYIVAMSKPNDIVLDMTGGVATAALAAMKHFRNSISIEGDRSTCDLSKHLLCYFANNFSSNVYSPARFNVFEELKSPPPIREAPTEDFRPTAADVLFMQNYRAIEPPLQISNQTEELTDMQKIDTFPIWALTKFQQNLIEEYVLCSKADPNVAAVSALTTWSAALGRSWISHDPTRDATDYPNLQAMILGHTGLGKSVADKITKPVRKSEELARWIRKARGQNTAPCYVYDDITSSALIGQLKSSDETGFLFSSEAGGLINALLKQASGMSGNLFDFLLKGFCVEQHRNMTNTHGDRTIVPCIAQLLLAQPSLGRKLLGNKDFEVRGLANRWIMLEVPRAPLQYESLKKHKPDQNVLRTWHSLNRKAMRNRIIGLSKVMRHEWSDAALSSFKGYQNAIIDKINNEWAGKEDLLMRSRELHKRIALGLLAADYYAGDEAVLTRDHDPALRAEAIIGWINEQRVGIMTGVQQEESIALKRRLLDLLWTKPDQQINLRDLLRRHYVSEEQVIEILKCFPKVFELISPPPTGKAGRPGSKVLRLMMTK